ncbi:anthrone oxygenase family protein [Spirosoma pollinicola]|uniref:DUF1772 domain-containing protein n=1 Tax=Spirosoma pollinicola TaxID=2057025 RepID=A0A2K8YTW2_9BACT|nr:anthrone oxygenase family protein [Spirosoma pollinicola]AUD01072.1 DUF1772 domain-containing protein [Spirosoma pollinicola]
MPTLSNTILACATLTTALMAGLFYAYSCSVNPGLNRLPDTAYLMAMQSINKAIQNPVFFVSFLGTPILLLYSTWLHYGSPVTARFWLLVGATLVYLIGALGVTVLGNIPLNNGLDAFSIQTASLEEIAAQRQKFEGPWGSWHLIRTIASISTLILLILACLNRESD